MRRPSCHKQLLHIGHVPSINPVPTKPHSDWAPPEDRRRGAVAVLVREGRVLVVRRSQWVVAPGAYCFPGGAIEGTESEEEALVREIREELGLTVAPVRRLWQSVTPWHVELAWWLAKLEDAREPVPDPAEIESALWCTPQEMAALVGLLPSNQAFLDALGHGAIALPELGEW